MIGLVGKKLGMTRIFTKEGISIPVTIIEIKKNFISQIKTIKKDSYNAIQITTGLKKFNRVLKPESGHFLKAGIKVGKGLWEFRCDNINDFYLGQYFTVKDIKNIKKVDITGFSKGKGFAGTVKRWNFRTQDATHGNSLSHRVPGSIGQNQTPGRVFKGKKMSGHLGDIKVTIQNLKIISFDILRNVLLIKGSTPGSVKNYLIIKPAIKSI